MSTVSGEPSGMQMPRRIEIGTFQLTIRNLNTKEGDALSEEFRRKVAKHFAQQNPLLCNLYDLVIEEEEVWVGSRQSRNKVTLKKKKGGSFFKTVKRGGAAALLALNLLSVDYELVRENFEASVHYVEEQLTQIDFQIEASDFEYFVPLNPSPLGRRKKRKRKD